MSGDSSPTQHCNNEKTVVIPGIYALVHNQEVRHYFRARIRAIKEETKTLMAEQRRLTAEINMYNSQAESYQLHYDSEVARVKRELERVRYEQAEQINNARAHWKTVVSNKKAELNNLYHINRVNDG